MKTLLAVGATLAMIGAVHAQTALGADVIKQSFAGNTGEFAGQSATLFVFWVADGTQRMQSQGGPAVSRHGRADLPIPDSGVWRITPDGDFCGKWTRLRNGVEVCAPVIDVGGGFYQWGNVKFRILLGNPKGL